MCARVQSECNELSQEAVLFYVCNFVSHLQWKGELKGWNEFKYEGIGKFIGFNPWDMVWQTDTC